MLWTTAMSIAALYTHNNWQIRHIDSCTATTTLRLWHELHVAKSISHDFCDMLAPPGEGFYIAAIRHNEIRAVSKCLRDSIHLVTFDRIAHAPNQPDAASALIHLMHESRICFDWTQLDKQPRWYFEHLYHHSDASGSSFK